MNLKEFQKKYGIKRIDFEKVELNQDADTEYETDCIKCPYCGHVFDYEAEDIDDILGGTPYQCGECEKWFYVEGEMTIETTCRPMEQALLDNKAHIERSYKHMDECAAKGVEWDNAYGVVEWEVYKNFARPYFENLAKEE